ncbi:molybdopterin-dependent oxidoreductase [Cupriavidus neocaledonicus]|nr:molybdopterin-dependent oxidoreductase [Cupriavidus neocaledonicus]
MSKQFRISGAVMRPASFDLATLQAMPAVTRTVGNTTYTGVSLWNLINAADISVNRAVKNDILRGYVVATGSDGYQVVISLGEISPEFGNQPDLIAYRADGAPLTSNGFARLVVPNDIKGGRFVSNLVSLEVRAAAPAP